MMNDAEFWLEIKLLLIAGNTPSPLHRTLARTAWRRSPVASVWYEPEWDRILIQLVEAPTVAEAIPGDALDSDPCQAEGREFVGFDGIEPDAWPTMIVVLEFSRCRNRDMPRMRLAKELCGDHIWTAARSVARGSRPGRLEVPLGHDEAEFLIRRWHAILCRPSAPGETDPVVFGHQVQDIGIEPDRPIRRTHWYADRATTLHGPPDRESR